MLMSKLAMLCFMLREKKLRDVHLKTQTREIPLRPELRLNRVVHIGLLRNARKSGHTKCLCLKTNFCTFGLIIKCLCDPLG